MGGGRRESAVVNSVNENAFLFRFDAGPLPTPDTIAPAKPEQVQAN